MNLIDKFLSILPENNRRERIWKIAQVDFKKRYYNDRLGLIWAMANPMSRIAIYYFVFTRIFQRGHPNFALYIFSGLVIWMAFAQATSTGSLLLRTKRYLIENIQFDWLDLYYSHMISSTISLLFNLAAYFVILYFTGGTIGYNLYLLPFMLLTWFFATTAASLLLGVIRPVFDDIVHIWNVIIMLGFWSSGIFYDGSFFFDSYTWFLYVNPFVGIILNTRAILLENNIFNYSLFYYNLSYCFVLFLISVFIFRRYAHKVIEKI